MLRMLFHIYLRENHRFTCIKNYSRVETIIRERRRRGTTQVRGSFMCKITIILTETESDGISTLARQRNSTIFHSSVPLFEGVNCFAHRLSAPTTKRRLVFGCCAPPLHCVYDTLLKIRCVICVKIDTYCLSFQLKTLSL